MPIDVFEAARRYIAKMPDLCRAESDPQDSHSVLFTVACALVKGFDLSAGDALALLDEYTRRSDTPWTPQSYSIRFKALRSHLIARARGWLLPSDRAFSKSPRDPEISARAES
jgi:hypothetical protein